MATLTLAAPAPEGFAVATIEVNDKVKQPDGSNAFRPLGSFEAAVPTVAAVAAVLAEASLEVDAEASKDNEGVPVYKDDKVNWIQRAITSQVKAQARNRIQPKSCELKPNRSLIAGWTELLEELTGTGNAEGLKAIAEAKRAFAEWLPTTGKSEKAQVQLAKFFANRAALESQPSTIKEKVAIVLGGFAESLTAEQADRFERYLSNLADACSSEEVDADDL